MSARAERSAEPEIARRIAERWLERPPDLMGDPDCEECVVARQYLRARELIEQMRESVEDARAREKDDHRRRRLADLLSAAAAVMGRPI